MKTHPCDRIYNGAMQRSYGFCAIMLGIAVNIVATGTPARAEVSAESSGRIDAIFESRTKQGVPGCAVGVAENGRTLVERAYGMADVGLGVPARPDSIYEAGSVSKQFTAAAVLLLARDGKLRLDDNIRTYLPELPDYGTPVTIRHMLHHTSGLRDWGAISALEGWPRNTRTFSNDDVLMLAARQRALNFTPGTHFLYSNTNYNLLAILVARVSGESLAAFSAARIFAPLGMAHTRWREDHGTIVRGRTTAYTAAAGVYSADQPIEDAYGNGGLLTTVGDLLLWNAGLDADRLGPGLTAAMQEAGVLTDGTRITYAAGLRIFDHVGNAEVGHSGQTGGYRTWLARYPAHGLSVALLCNATDVDTAVIGRQIADMFLPPRPVPAEPAVQGSLPSGLYASTVTGFPLAIAVAADGRLLADGKVPMPVGQNRWRIGSALLDVAADGTLTGITQAGERWLYRKVGPVTHVDAPAYAGRYCGTDNPICLTVEAGGTGLAVGWPRGPSLPFAPSYADTFEAGSGVLMTFTRDDTGRVTGLRISSERAWNVAFAREM